MGHWAGGAGAGGEGTPVGGEKGVSCAASDMRVPQTLEPGFMMSVTNLFNFLQRLFLQ